LSAIIGRLVSPPALVLTLEYEHGVHVHLVADSYEDQLRLLAWLDAKPNRREAIEELLGHRLDLETPASAGRLAGSR
jgi:hypothetical protein